MSIFKNKYRVQIIERRRFGIRYVPQVRIMFMWFCIDRDGMVDFDGVNCLTLDDAIDLVELHYNGGCVVKDVKYVHPIFLSDRSKIKPEDRDLMKELNRQLRENGCAEVANNDFHSKAQDVIIKSLDKQILKQKS